MTVELATSQLQELASRINSAHSSIEASLRRSLGEAIEAGDLLIQAQRLVPHGEWEHWLSDNFSGSPRTARTYMRLAENRAQLEANGIGDMSIEFALRSLAEPRKPQNKLRANVQPLSDNERKRLAELEGKLEALLADPAAVAEGRAGSRALANIRDQRLWRGRHQSFDAYLRDRHGFNEEMFDAIAFLFDHAAA